jgi:hypothetical protein
MHHPKLRAAVQLRGAASAFLNADHGSRTLPFLLLFLMQLVAEGQPKDQHGGYQAVKDNENN